MIRIPDSGVTEQLVIFAEQAVLDKIKPGERVLDIGCGRGVLTEKIAAKGARVTAIDLISDEIQAAKARGSEIDYRCLAAEKLDSIEDEFDLIVSSFAFHHLDFPRAAKCIETCMKPGGALFVVDCYRDFWILNGRIYVLRSALRILGVRQFLRVMSRTGYFFSPKRFEHVRSDIRRLREQKRYTLKEVRLFYEELFPGCNINTLGCAFTLSWRRS